MKHKVCQKCSSATEYSSIQRKVLNSSAGKVQLRINVGDEVRILSGALANFTGIVEEIDIMRQKLRVTVKMFLGREMQIEVDLDQVEKID